MKRIRDFSKTAYCLLSLSVLLGWSGLVPNAASQVAPEIKGPYKPDWASLRKYPVPQWLRDGNFGIYTHWGVYSVPASQGVWFGSQVYNVPDSAERKYHEATFGPLEKFGYKDFIPMFTAEKY